MNKIKGEILMKRNIKIIPAFDYLLTDKGDSKYGRASAYMVCSLEGEKGKVVLEVNTKWFLPITSEYLFNKDVIDNHSKRDLETSFRCHYNGAKSHILYILSKEPIDDMIQISGTDKFYAYVPFATTHEQDFVDILVRDGSDKMFEELEKVYMEYIK